MAQKRYLDYHAPRSTFLLNERWKEELTDESVAIINSRIDKNLVAYFGYEILAS